MLGKLDFLLAVLAAELTMLCASLTHWRLSAGRHCYRVVNC